MAVGDVYQVDLSFQTGSIPTLVTSHWVSNDDIVPVDPMQPAEAVARAIHASDWMDTMLACISEDVELTSIYARRIHPTPHNPFLFVVGATLPNQGGGAIGACPPQVAMLFSEYTAEYTRRGRGRMYIPGCPEAGNNEGVVSAGQMTLMQEFVQECLVEIDMIAPATGDVALCVWSRVEDNFFPVVQVVANSNLATQRGRRARPGAPI